jgi:hypothetical protein
MLDLSILQNVYVILSVLGGVVLTLTVALTYQALWKPRAGAGERIATQEIKGPVTFLKWWTAFVPWVITLTLLGIAIYGIFYVLAKIANPPNW